MGGSPSVEEPTGGPGGGSGGAILLEAANVTFGPDAKLCANGGGGAGGTGTTEPMSGQDGTCSLVPAPGGGAPAEAGKGGNGATATTVATPGRAGDGVVLHGGGGGVASGESA